MNVSPYLVLEHTPRVLFMVILLSGSLTNTASAENWRVESGGTPACILRSDSVKMYDGYQDTAIHLRITADRLTLEAKAPIDDSFGDLALITEQKNPAAAEALQKAEARLAAAQAFATEDEAALTDQIKTVRQEIEAVAGHRWYKDYKKNPINAGRLDNEMAAAKARLAPLQQRLDGLLEYRAALAEQRQAAAAVAELKDFPPVKGERLEERKTLHFDADSATLVKQFLQGTGVRAALRFWPTWPATGIHEAHIDLQDFATAYKEFQTCSQP